jgi:hypothetical protein
VLGKTLRERKTNEFRKFEVLSFPLFSLFYIFNQLGLSIDISLPIHNDSVRLFTGIALSASK